MTPSRSSGKLLWSIYGQGYFQFHNIQKFILILLIVLQQKVFMYIVTNQRNIEVQ